MGEFPAAFLGKNKLAFVTMVPEEIPEISNSIAVRCSPICPKGGRSGGLSTEAERKVSASGNNVSNVPFKSLSCAERSDTGVSVTSIANAAFAASIVKASAAITTILLFWLARIV